MRFVKFFLFLKWINDSECTLNYKTMLHIFKYFIYHTILLAKNIVFSPLAS